jgi:uncharacterized membrane protein
MMKQQPTTEQILDRARQEIAARHTQEAQQDRDSPIGWLWTALVVAAVLAFLAIPGWLQRKLLLAMGGVCGLRPAHSYFAGEIQLPMESRMVGIYGGFSLTLLVLLTLRRLGSRRLGGKLIIGILALFFASMAFDGINSTMSDLGLPHLYTSTNLTRLLTGLLSGTAIAPFLLWLVSAVAMPRDKLLPRAVIGSAWELLLPLTINAVFATAVISEQAAFYYPIALLSVSGVVFVLASVSMLVILGVSGLQGRVMRPRQVVAPGSLALLVAFTVLAAAAALRWSFSAVM